MNQEQKHKSVCGKIMIIFIVLVLLLTFFSKSFYNYKLPHVSVEYPKQGKLDFKEESEVYDALIPASALRKDSKGYYVLTLQKDEGILGDGYKAERNSVDLLASDETHCAVEGIPEGTGVIVTDVKELAEGDHVYFRAG